MNSIDLLALDIDDTLVDSSLRISDNNMRAIGEAVAVGTTVVLASGRGYLGTKPVRDSLHLHTPVINYSGSVIMDAATDHCLHAHYLDRQDILDAFAIADRHSLHAQLYDGDTVVFRCQNAFTEQYTSRLHLPFRIDPDMLSGPLNDVPKVLVYADPSLADDCVRLFEASLPEHLHVLTSKPGFLEIGHRSCTKGSALQWLAKHLNISQKHVAAIGDNTLDLDMIEWAGVGCCVSNGSEKVKARCDLVLPSCQEDGVAAFIDAYILHRG